MDRLDYQNRFGDLLDDACDNLSGGEFELFIKRVREAIDNCMR